MNIRKILFFSTLIIGLAGLLAASFWPRERSVEEIGEQRQREAYLLLLADLPAQSNDYLEYLRSHPGEYAQGAGEISLIPDGDEITLLDEPFTAVIRIPEPGYYSMNLLHRRTDDGLGNIELSLTINGAVPFNEAAALELRREWRDDSKVFGRDRYNDETLPLQLPEKAAVNSTLYDPAGRTIEPLLLYFEPGGHEITLQNRSNQEVSLVGISLQPRRSPASYDEYRSSLPDTDRPVDGVEINAISYTAKNSYDVRLASLDKPTANPFHPVDNLLNIVDGESWDESGEEISYSFSLPESGDYAISLHYNNPKSDFSTFRTLAIDGLIPFREVSAYEFPATGGSKWGVETIASDDGEPYRFRLSAGDHTLSLRAEKAPVADAIRMLKTITAHMNFFGIEIMKVAGRDIDEERTWRLTDYIEKTPDYLDAYRVLVSDIIGNLALYSKKGIDSSITASLYTVLFKLEKISEDPNELPIYLNDIYSTSIYDRPITRILGETVNLLEDSRMSLDAIYIEPEPSRRRANAPIFKRLGSSLQSLAATFYSEKYVTRISEDELNVWVTRPITHIDLMQKMTDAAFTRNTGVPVKISTMPEPNRLILATAADTTPDLAMGMPHHIPFDLAVRGALVPLSSFPDFWEYASKFSPGAFIPYVLNEEVYGIPETLDFHSLVYRQDIFRQLELKPPDTWQDVIDMLPTLQRFGMNFYHPIAGGLPTLKWFYQTSPFVYQYGGKLYHPDGLSVSLDEQKTVEGLRFLSELFSLYALQEQVPAFYNSFRFGIIPAGIVDSQTYLQLKYAAPELRGQWALAPYPGVPDENGEPQRWFIANGVAAVIMSDSERPNESWEYLKWWLSTESQVDFGYRLQSTYGPEFLWISGNLEALAQAPIDADELDVIFEQVKWQRDVPRTPAQYILERALSDIWINSATKYRPVRTEIDKMIPVVDREVRRKMIEFGYIDENLTVLEPYIVPDIDWIKAKVREAGNNE